ncbi:hypothetical protein BDV40DRAFT_313930 [Aspergillus tamarii]|uniref:Uncharacterized protein n=1 Tax=Aspergillus tamarii TaxID=41984 RepID=A0A5N6UQR8_ASPTM|nr:hypothetical protein BDV40DRAFT_313930 [Aspergillus tamarii]
MAKCSESWKASQLEKKRKACCEFCQQTRGRVSTKIKEDYRKRVRKYEEFFIEEKNMPEGYKIGEGYPAPILKEFKEFICWLIESTKGRVADDGRLIMNTILVCVQEFISDARELYYWIEKELVYEGVFSAIRKPKYNFKLRDFERAIIAFWAIDNLFFISERYRVQFYFIIF